MPDVEDRHTLLFSATFPDKVQKLAKQFLRPEYLFIEIGIVGGACQGTLSKFQFCSEILEYTENLFRKFYGWLFLKSWFSKQKKIKFLLKKFIFRRRPGDPANWEQRGGEEW